METRTQPRWLYGALAVTLAAWAGGRMAHAGGGCCGGGMEAHAEESKGEPKPVAAVALYPLETCPLSGKKLNAEGAPVIYDHKGRELRFSSKDCIQAFLKGPEGSLAKIDQAIIAQQLPAYPMKTCLVSGDEFGGEMGEPVNKVYQNRLVRFCCKMCAPEFEKDPAKFLAKLDQAVVAREKPTYPLTICVVSGDKLEGGEMEPRDYVFAGRLVRFCCPDCVKDFGKDPWKYMAKIDAAKGKKPEAPKDEGKKGGDDHGHGHHGHGDH